ncbi:hypothetical protein U1Q18_010982, partial [Sarracenia purpurea var. burkii]
MGSLSKWWVGLVVLALVASPGQAISCQDAEVKLFPCLSFLVGKGDGVTVPCCDGAQALNRLAASKPDRQAVCGCFKRLAPSLGVKADRAKQIPTLCKIDVGVPIDFSVDCS